MIIIKLNNVFMTTCYTKESSVLRLLNNNIIYDIIIVINRS